MTIKNKISKILSWKLLLFLIIPITANASTIKGRIIDSYTHEIVIGATVTVENHKNHFAVSDAEGNYIIENLTIGTYIIHSKSLGYQNSYTQEINITSEDQTVTFDIYLI